MEEKEPLEVFVRSAIVHELAYFTDYPVAPWAAGGSGGRTAYGAT
jgi:hypothetical protein